MTVQNTPELAIVGGGIVGLICALGLIDRGINVRVYEQADGLRENGAGLAFTRNAVECLRLVSPLASEALRSVQTPNGDTTHPNDHLQWVDGFNQHDQNDPMYEPVLFKLFVGANGFEGCHRAHLLEALWKRLPSGSVIFGKKLQTIDDDPHNNKAILHFMDGSTAQADAGELPRCFPAQGRLTDRSSHRMRRYQITYQSLVVRFRSPGIETSVYTQALLPSSDTNGKGHCCSGSTKSSESMYAHRSRQTSSAFPRRRSEASQRCSIQHEL